MTDYNETVCPSCGHDLAPIFYGYPTTEMIDLAKADVIALGGFTNKKENRYCYSCNEIFYIPTDLFSN